MGLPLRPRPILLDGPVLTQYTEDDDGALLPKARLLAGLAANLL
jgi:hypothetical protein